MDPWRPDPASAVPLYRQVADRIADDIRGGRLPPGAGLPSIRALARELLVSVITTSRAYDALHAEGWITTRPGAGTFVADVREDSARAGREEARRTLAVAVRRARRLGLDDDAIRSFVHLTLQEDADG